MSRPLREHPSTPEFLREFQEEHLSELAFLLAQRQRHLHSTEVEWPRVEALEMRILRHAEAMQGGGDTAILCAREVLASEAPDELTAGAYALVHVAPGEAGITDVLRRMAEADAALLPALAEALVLVPHPLLAKKLGLLLTAPRPEVRAMTARILGHRRDSEAGPLLPLLDDDSLEVRAAAARALAELGDPSALPAIHQKLDQAPADELDVWLLAALRLGSSRALHMCRQVCRTPGNISPRLPWLLGLAGDAQDFASLRQLHHRPELRVAVLDALGLLGVPTAVPLLLEHLGHEKPEVKEAAAMALALMTDAGLTETVQFPNTESVDGDDAEEDVREEARPSTHAAEWRAWWGAHSSRLAGSARLRLGKPYSLGLCIEELAHPRSLFDTRMRAALELTIRSGQSVGFQPDWPICRQHQAITHWRQWWAERTKSR